MEKYVGSRFGELLHELSHEHERALKELRLTLTTSHGVVGPTLDAEATCRPDLIMSEISDEICTEAIARSCAFGQCILNDTEAAAALMDQASPVKSGLDECYNGKTSKLDVCGHVKTNHTAGKSSAGDTSGSMQSSRFQLEIGAQSTARTADSHRWELRGAWTDLSSASQALDGNSSGLLIRVMTHFDASDSTATMSKGSNSHGMSMTLSQQTRDEQAVGAWHVSRPTAPWRICWHIIALLAIGYDLIDMPLQLMNPPQPVFTLVISWCNLFFWNLDIIGNFCVGYYDTNGDLVMSPIAVARHYMSSWFGMDLCLVVLDWVFLILNGGSLQQGAADSDAGFAQSAGKAVRVIRFLRILRLLRLLKVQGVMVQLLDYVAYGTTLLYFLVVKILVVVLIINHVMACFFYSIGRDGWVWAAKLGERSFEYRYTVAFCWALAQFGFGGSSIYPTNEAENVYAIISGLIALVVVSSLVGMIADALLRLQQANNEQSLQFLLMRRYCRENRIAKDLFERILRYAEFAYRQRSHRTQTTDIALVSLLSEPLRNELHLATWKPHITVHKLFKELCYKEATLMQYVCKEAISDLEFAKQDTVFHLGEVATRMLFVVDGSLIYKRKQMKRMSVKARNWVTEAVLWVEWLHMGDLTAGTECRLAALDASRFCAVAREFAGGHSRVRRYAERYRVVMNKANWSELSDLQDQTSDRFRFLLPHVSIRTIIEADEQTLWRRCLLWCKGKT